MWISLKPGWKPNAVTVCRAYTLRHYVRRISMKNPCLTLCLFDCCREYKFTASEKLAAASEKQPDAFKQRGGEASGQEIIAYACNANDYAYDDDGTGEHGSDFIHLTTPFALE